jgi:hypothetical protein
MTTLWTYLRLDNIIKFNQLILVDLTLSDSTIFV